MGLFTPRADLEGKIATLEKENGDMSAEIERLEGELSNVQGDLAAARKVIAESPSAELVDDLQTKLGKAEEAAKPENIEAKAIELVAKDAPPEPIQKLIAQRVTEQLASAGSPVPLDNPDKEAAGTKTITRAEFDAMDHSQRNAHITSGGKLKD